MLSKIQQTPKKSQANYQNITLQSKSIDQYGSGNRNLKSSPIKKQNIKNNVKLQYLHSEISSIIRFKQFAQQINLLTKEVVQRRSPKQGLHLFSQHSNSLSKAKNSFKFNQISFRNTSIETFASQLKLNQGEQSYQSNASQSSQTQNMQSLKIDFQKLVILNQTLKKKNKKIKDQIQQIKISKIKHSANENDYFYLCTQFEYEKKLEEIENMIEKSELNLQIKQKDKKTLIFQNKEQQKTNILKFSNFRLNSNENQTIKNYLQAKQRIKQQLVTLNFLNSKFQFLFKKIDQGKNSQSNPSNEYQQIEKQRIKTNQHLNHHIVISASKLKQKIKDIFEMMIVRQKNSQLARNQKHASSVGKQNSSSSLQLRILIFNQLNKQLVYQQLKNTKKFIRQLKYQNQYLQSSIQENQAFKAMLILRKNIQNRKDLENDESLNELSKFKQQILSLILEHQFLMKRIHIYQQTGFFGLQKRSIKSKEQNQSEHNNALLKKIQKLRRCESEDNLNKQRLAKQLGKQQLKLLNKQINQLMISFKRMKNKNKSKKQQKQKTKTKTKSANQD